jgi:hypothetical protein
MVLFSYVSARLAAVLLSSMSPRPAASAALAAACRMAAGWQAISGAAAPGWLRITPRGRRLGHAGVNAARYCQAGDESRPAIADFLPRGP